MPVEAAGEIYGSSQFRFSSYFSMTDDSSRFLQPPRKRSPRKLPSISLSSPTSSSLSRVAFSPFLFFSRPRTNLSSHQYRPRRLRHKWSPRPRYQNPQRHPLKLRALTFRPLGQALFPSLRWHRFQPRSFSSPPFSLPLRSSGSLISLAGTLRLRLRHRPRPRRRRP